MHCVDTNPCSMLHRHDVNSSWLLAVHCLIVTLSTCCCDLYGWIKYARATRVRNRRKFDINDQIVVYN
jgi:predicted nucleic acid-binding protein